MQDEIKDEEIDKAMEEYIDEYLKKTHFTIDTMNVLATHAGSELGGQIFGNIVNAFNKLTELVRKHNNEQELLEEYTSYFEPFYDKLERIM